MGRANEWKKGPGGRKRKGPCSLNEKVRTPLGTASGQWKQDSEIRRKKKRDEEKGKKGDLNLGNGLPLKWRPS